MREHFFESGFKFEKYITERLLEIKDDEERRVLKEVMRETMIPFYQQVEAAYEELEDKITNAKTVENARYEIITGIEHRGRVDVTEEAMVPMNYADLNETIIDTGELQDALGQGLPYKIMTIFVQMDYSELRRIEREKRVYKAVVYTEDGEYSADVILQKNISYQQQIKEVYYAFETTGTEWKTVCMPYIAKFFDVYITATQCPADEDIEGIKVNFEEYESKIIYDFIPMWNVRILEENTSAYPDLALDRIHYEHCIFGNRINEERDYLIATEDEKLWEVFRKDGDLHIVCDEETPRKWRLFEIGYDAWKQQYDMPIFGNYWHRKAGYRCIHTMAELRKTVAELGYEKYMILQDIRRVDGIYTEPRLTYSMDSFIEDEIRIGANRSKLIFKFKATDKEFYLNRDIMSYILSRIQWQLPEFECIGEME